MDKRKKLTRKEFNNLVRENMKLYKELYFNRDLTARQVAESQNILYEDWIPRVLYQVLGSKKKGYGGKRQNSGNKKGIRFCGGCRKKIKDCKKSTIYCVDSDDMIKELKELLPIVTEKDKKIIEALIYYEESGNIKAAEQIAGIKIQSIKSYRRKFIKKEFPVIAIL